MEFLDVLIDKADGPTLFLAGVIFLWWRLRKVEGTITTKLENGLSSEVRTIRQEVTGLRAACEERGRNCPGLRDHG